MGGAVATAMKREELGDLNIPERITQAQVGLRRDQGMVREFAANVERAYHLFFCPLVSDGFCIV